MSYGGNATVPEEPSRTGYTFAGWYADEALTTMFSFDTAITGDVTLYAQWIKKTSSSSTNASQIEHVVVNVENGEQVSGFVVTQMTVTRTTDANGKKTDLVIFTAELAARTVKQLTAAGSVSARLVLPDPKDEVAAAAAKLLADGGINLKIATDGALSRRACSSSITTEREN
ncbi:InlB B-repeat-containing protein [Cohnella fermenti]|uniref:Uncharacterized protein n=1 Tax=Cohnella fermenti TaxID=2565925 RepID=A0A4S4C730_9BACL|nr:InlB B-repeat-containing protein [Cohnella fermenti]THF83748.1 hypothetical protein E6C55_03405 [Cohnella fermenti]